MGNIIPRFNSPAVTPSPSAPSPRATRPAPTPAPGQTPSPTALSQCALETPSSRRPPPSPSALGTPQRPLSPAGRRRRPARPTAGGPAPRTSPPSASSRPTPRARRLFSPSGCVLSDQSGCEEALCDTICWESPSGGERSSSSWFCSSSSSPSPIYSPQDQGRGPYGRNAFISCSPGPYVSTPRR